MGDKSLERIRAASDETLLAIAGIGPRHVRALREHFGAVEPVEKVGVLLAPLEESGNVASFVESVAIEVPATEE
mgnify:CR=1 FL=1